MSYIEVSNITKEFKIVKREKGAFNHRSWHWRTP